MIRDFDLYLPSRQLLAYLSTLVVVVVVVVAFVSFALAIYSTNCPSRAVVAPIQNHFDGRLLVELECTRDGHVMIVVVVAPLLGINAVSKNQTQWLVRPVWVLLATYSCSTSRVRKLPRLERNIPLLETVRVAWRVPCRVSSMV